MHKLDFIGVNSFSVSFFHIIITLRTGCDNFNFILKADELSFQEGDNIYIIEKVKLSRYYCIMYCCQLRMTMAGGKPSVEVKWAWFLPIIVSGSAVVL